MTKSEYDAYRQSVSDRAASLVNQYNGTPVISEKTRILGEMDSLMSAFKSTTDATRCVGTVFNCISSDWLDPRFHDYYDFFTRIADSWRVELASAGASSVPTSGSTAGCLAGICGPTTPLQPVATGSAGGGGGVSIAYSGGAGSISPTTVIPQGTLSPSPSSSDLPGIVSIPLNQVSPSQPAGAMETPIQTASIIPANLLTWVKSPLGIIVLIGMGLLLLTRYPAGARG